MEHDDLEEAEPGEEPDTYQEVMVLWRCSCCGNERETYRGDGCGCGRCRTCGGMFVEYGREWVE